MRFSAASNRRIHERLLFQTDVVCVADGNWFGAQAVNVSRGGLLLLSSEKIRRRTRIKLRFVTKAGHPPGHVVRGQVLYSDGHLTRVSFPIPPLMGPIVRQWISDCTIPQLMKRLRDAPSDEVRAELSACYRAVGNVEASVDLLGGEIKSLRLYVTDQQRILDPGHSHVAQVQARLQELEGHAGIEWYDGKLDLKQTDR